MSDRSVMLDVRRVGQHWRLIAECRSADPERYQLERAS
jgi:hypothetical protein